MKARTRLSYELDAGTWLIIDKNNGSWVISGFSSSNVPELDEMDGLELLHREYAEFPSYLIINCTNGCNLHCKYCYKQDYVSNRVKPEFLPRAHWEDVLNYCHRLVPNAEPVIEFHGGEPLLFADTVMELADYLKRGLGANVHFTLVTNGTLITREMAEGLAQRRFTVSVSLDGPETVHNENRSDFQRTLAGVDHLRQANCRVRTLSTYTSSTSPHIEDILEFLLTCGFNDGSLRPATLQGVSSQHSSSTPGVFVDANCWLNSSKMVFAWLVRKHVHGVFFGLRETEAWVVNLFSNIREYGCLSFPCSAFHTLVSVNSDGSVCPCDILADHDDVSRAADLDEFANNYSLLLDGWTRQSALPRECLACGFQTICCGGCTGERLAQRGSGEKPEFCDAYAHWILWLVEQYTGSEEARQYIDKVVTLAEGRTGSRRIRNYDSDHTCQSASR